MRSLRRLSVFRSVTQSARPAAVALAGVVVFASCMQGQKPPAVQPNNTLELDSESQAHISEQKFGVVFGTPQGKMPQPDTGV